MSDAQIGQNVARARGQMPQSELASRMRDRGWKWSQSTVWAVEKGERPVRLAEALDLIHILDVPFGYDFLTASQAEIELSSTLEHSDRAWTALQTATDEFLDAQFELAVAADALELDSGAAQEVLSALERSVESAIADYAAVWRATRLELQEFAHSGPFLSRLLEAWHLSRGGRTPIVLHIGEALPAAGPVSAIGEEDAHGEHQEAPER